MQALTLKLARCSAGHHGLEVGVWWGGMHNVAAWKKAFLEYSTSPEIMKVSFTIL